MTFNKKLTVKNHMCNVIILSEASRPSLDLNVYLLATQLSIHDYKLLQ